MAQSNWYLLGQAVAQRLQAVADAQGVKLLLHPPLPLDLGTFNSLPAKRALMLIHRGDKALEQPGQRNEKRQMRLIVGAVVLEKDALAACDALHFAARSALREDATWTAFRAITQVANWKETEVEPELKDIAAEGHALLSAIEIPYFQTYPNAA